MKEELRKYAVEPEDYWGALHYSGYDGYDIMEQVESQKWKPISSWGKDGWNLGSWPYVVVYFRNRPNCYEVLVYVEGDVEKYSCPTKEIREQITNEIAHFYWTPGAYHSPDNMENYPTADDMPDELKGPPRN